MFRTLRNSLCGMRYGVLEHETPQTHTTLPSHRLAPLGTRLPDQRKNRVGCGEGCLAMKLYPGHIIKTSYGTGPYLIVKVLRGCTCPEYVASLSYPYGGAPPSPPHIHLTCTYLEGHNKGHEAYLSGYDDHSLKSVWNRNDHLILVGSNQIQMTMF